jgi:DNA adenine methylase
MKSNDLGHIFRYPGGKKKLFPKIQPFLFPLIEKNKSFAEPFVGGGSVMIEVAKAFNDIPIFINDKNEGVSAFWEMINSPEEDVNALFELIKRRPTIDIFNQLRINSHKTKIQKAYNLLFMNRCCFSGIETAGPIGGMEQSSKWKIDCRYNADKIIASINYLRDLLKGRLIVSNDDVIDFIKRNKPAFYLDPPYYEKGDSLYPVKMDHDEHLKLADLLKSKEDWVLSYDEHPEIRKIYDFATIKEINARYSIDGKKDNWKNTHELIIYRG